VSVGQAPAGQHWPGFRLYAALFFAIFLLAACATSVRPADQNTSQNTADKAFYSGRISLQVASEPAQFFAGGFELEGNPTTGQLNLFTPLGGTAAVLRWSPGLAQLQNGGNTQQFQSVQAMLEQTTGAAIPLEALFAWLHGDAAQAPGWQADLSRHAEGRISALRSEPAPIAQLRIVLEK
jgi:outer membrane lipoprotein LolB